MTQLTEAVERNDLKEVKRLIKEGVDLDERDRGMQAPLHYAAHSDKYLKIAQLLIEHGASTKTHNRASETPLDLAEWSGSKEMRELFIRAYFINNSEARSIYYKILNSMYTE